MDGFNAFSFAFGATQSAMSLRAHDTGQPVRRANPAEMVASDLPPASPDALGPAALSQGTLPICGDFDMRIARDGTWFYHGSPIGRKPLVKLFASVLRREHDGSYWLVTPVERGRIAVDDAPFVAVELTATGSGRDQILVFRTNLDETITVGPAFPIRVVEDASTGEPTPYVVARSGRDGQPGLDALIARAAFYQLVELAVEDPADSRRLGVWSGGAFFALGRQ